MSRFLKTIVVLLGLLLLGTLGVSLALRHRVQTGLNALQAQQDAEGARFRARIEADSARWKDDPLLAPHDGGDAAALLFVHLRWMDDGRQPPVPARLAEQLQALGSDWGKHVEELDFTGVDLTWMSQLAQFGFWDVEAAGSPLADAPWAPVTEGMPNFIDAQHLGRGRLAQGLQSGSAVVAAAEVRELARLCLSSERLVGEMVGVALLSIERRAREEAVRRNQDVTGWTSISEEDQQALKRVLYVAPARFGLFPVALPGEAPGACTGLWEGLGQAYLVRGYLHDVLAERYAALTTTLAASPCRLRRARLAWASDPTGGGLPVEGHLPFARSLTGLRLARLGALDAFKQYRDQPDGGQ